jgi:hypothetical protein
VANPGSITLDDSAGGLTVTSATTFSGTITLTAAGGNLTLVNIATGNSQDMAGITTGGGDILVGSVGAGRRDVDAAILRRDHGYQWLRGEFDRFGDVFDRRRRDRRGGWRSRRT